MKTILTLFTLAFFTLHSFTQVKMDKIKNLKKDPSTMETAAKADVWIIKKKNIIVENSNTNAVIRPKKRKTLKN